MTGATVCLVAFLDRETRAVVRVSPMIYDMGRGFPRAFPNDAGYPSLLTWVNMPTLDQAEAAMVDLLGRPEWAWVRPLRPPDPDEGART